MACLSAITDGVFYYVDCCGVPRTGASLAQTICIDEALSGTSYGIIIDSGQTCTQNCIQGGLDYTFQVTGVCSAATGTITFNPFGGAAPYTIDNIIPGTITAQTSYNPITFTGLTEGVYVFRLNDTLGLQNNELYINVAVTECFEARIVASGTTCGVDNGSLQVSASTTGSPYTIILYQNGSVYDVETTSVLPYTFTGLEDGIYYATVVDYGATTANTENGVISASTAVNFGFWKVDTSNCVTNWGKLAVTGITGTGPYTYLWSNGATTQVVTGLTQGVYSCTVTDSLGCQTTLSETVGVATPMSLALLTAQNPSCFSSDGSLTFTISGGSGPYYYSANTSQVGYTLSNTFTITGLTSGNYQVSVTDASLCSILLNGNLSTPNGFSVASVNVIGSNCNVTNGQIDVTIQGVSGFYTYSLSGQNTNIQSTTTTQNLTESFTNLANDTYLLTISASGANCVYTNTYTISSIPKFSLNIQTTGATCGQIDGIAIIDVSTGYTTPLDYVLSNGNTIIDTPLSSITYNNLSAGSYTITVTDNAGCAVSSGFTINTGGGITASVATTNCTGLNDGTATVVINAGSPPFSYLWSTSQTGSSISNLAAGQYSVDITDSTGCTLTQYFSITCLGTNVTNYEIYNVCSNTFTTTSGNQRGLAEMLNEGYLDLISGYTNCVFNSAELVCEVTISGVTYTQPFYTATTLNDVPQDSLWQSTIEDILDTVPNISSYSIDLLNNTLTIISTCSGDDDPLADEDFTLGLEITYDIVCGI